MSTHSNVMPCSNVYVLEGTFGSDRKFQSIIRGISNLRIMVRRLAGLAPDSPIDVAIRDRYLTSEQREEWKAGMYCPLQDDKEDHVFGIVKKSDGYQMECRCYNTGCPHFSECVPYPDPSIIVRSSDWKREELAPKEVNIQVQPPEVEDDVPEKVQAVPLKTIEFVEEPDFSKISSPDSEDERLHSETQQVFFGQNSVIEGASETHMLVVAGPGTGKTYSLIEKLKYMVDETGAVDAGSILVLCFTRAAVKEIRIRLLDAIKSGNYSDDLSRIEIRTFDSFATWLLIERDVEFTGKDYDQRIQMAIDEIISDPYILQDLRHFFVDEVQDLVGVRARLVQVILENMPHKCGFTLLGDPLQGIYDYQVQDNPEEIDAKKLREWIRVRFADTLHLVRLTKNYRQKDRLACFTVESRELLEVGKVQTFLDNIQQVESCGQGHNFLMPAEKGTTAILCRTNGEVLKISCYLYRREIDHSVKRRRDKPLLPYWIGDLLINNGTQLNREQFIDFIDDLKLYSDNGRYNIYDSLCALDASSSGGFLNLQKFKKTLASGKRLPDELYEYGQSNIVVSTIHQSKGREYDSVLLLEPSKFFDDEHPEEESKVYYVALTRAKNQFYLIERSNRYAWLKRSKTDGRWMELRKEGNRNKLKFLEIGIDGDVDEQSFVDSEVLVDPEGIQQYIRGVILPGDRIELHLEEKQYYYIYHSGRLIGRMSNDFSHQLRMAFCEGFGNPHFSFWPSCIDGIFVDSIFTVVKPPETLRASVCEPYLSNGVWYGVSLAGMGKLRWAFD